MIKSTYIRVETEWSHFGLDRLKCQDIRLGRYQEDMSAKHMTEYIKWMMTVQGMNGLLHVPSRDFMTVETVLGTYGVRVLYILSVCSLQYLVKLCTWKSCGTLYARLYMYSTYMRTVYKYTGTVNR